MLCVSLFAGCVATPALNPQSSSAWTAAPAVRSAISSQKPAPGVTPDKLRSEPGRLLPKVAPITTTSPTPPVARPAKFNPLSAGLYASTFTLPPPPSNPAPGVAVRPSPSPSPSQALSVFQPQAAGLPRHISLADPFLPSSPTFSLQSSVEEVSIPKPGGRKPKSSAYQATGQSEQGGRGHGDKAGVKEELEDGVPMTPSDAFLFDEVNDAKEKKRKARRACLPCQRSHMTCDDGSPSLLTQLSRFGCFPIPTHTLI